MFKRSTSRRFYATTFHSLYQDREFLWNISNPYLIDALEQEFAFNGDNTAKKSKTTGLN